MTEQPPFRPDLAYMSFQDRDLVGSTDEPPVIVMRFLDRKANGSMDIMTMAVPWPFHGMDAQDIRHLMSVSIAMPSGDETAVFVDGRVEQLLVDHTMGLQVEDLLSGVTDMLAETDFD